MCEIDGKFIHMEAYRVMSKVRVFKVHKEWEQMKSYHALLLIVVVVIQISGAIFYQVLTN